MFNVDIDIKGLEKLEHHIEFVNAMLGMKTNGTFQKFIQEKVLRTAKEVTNRLLVGGTTDDEYIEEYKINHKIREFDGGFILYNDTTIPTSMLPVSEKTAENYPNGFCVALAFEYGIGIVGENDAKVGAWNYNVNNWNFAWYYKKNDVLYSTYGYSGLEIYRNIAIEVEKNMASWVKEFINKKEGEK